MAGCDFAQGRNLRLAPGQLRGGAPRVKRTAGGGMNGRGNVAGQHDAAALGIGVHDGHGGDERVALQLSRSSACLTR